MLSVYEEAADAHRAEEPLCHAAALPPVLLVGLQEKTMTAIKQVEGGLFVEASGLDQSDMARVTADIRKHIDHAIENGWEDIEEHLPIKRADRIEWFAEQIARRVLEGMPQPIVHLTWEGNLRARWSDKENIVTLEADLDSLSAEFMHLVASSARYESQTVSIDSSEAWDKVSATIKQIYA